jgi:hypothetical protein
MRTAILFFLEKEEMFDRGWWVIKSGWHGAVFEKNKFDASSFTPRTTLSLAAVTRCIKSSRLWTNNQQLSFGC